jgi:ribokinase
MQVLNFGSLNIDHVYQVDHFVTPGETLTAEDYLVNAGGKGLNQSIALGRAGVKTFHAGMIGREGIFLKETLERANVNTDHIILSDQPTGHAVIQVEKSSGQNSIVLFSGANMQIKPEDVKRIIAAQPCGSWLLLQNEINDIPLIIKEGKAHGLKIAINPAPCTPAVREYPLECCDLIFVNEIAAEQLTGESGTPAELASIMAERYPESEIIITLGRAGAIRRLGDDEIFVPAYPVKAVDTTSAGDTFTGFFLAAKLRGMDPESAMKCAAFASSITVSRPGAAASIPGAEEVFGNC